MSTPPRLLQDVLLATVARHPERTALVAGDARLSYQDVTGYACRLAHVLRSRGVQRGGRVVIFMENGWRCAASIFGVLLAGGVFVAVSAQTKRDKLAFILRDAGACALLAEPHLARVFVPVAEQSPALRVLCAPVAAASPPGTENVDEALADFPATPPPQSAITQDLAALLYTSGTTGEPKGVMHTHQSLLFVLDSINEYLGMTPQDRLFSALPLNFGYGLFQWLSAVRAGAPLVLERAFTYPARLHYPRRYAEPTGIRSGLLPGRRHHRRSHAHQPFVNRSGTTSGHDCPTALSDRNFSIFG